MTNWKKSAFKACFDCGLYTETASISNHCENPEEHKIYSYNDEADIPDHLTKAESETSSNEKETDGVITQCEGPCDSFCEGKYCSDECRQHNREARL